MVISSIPSTHVAFKKHKKKINTLTASKKQTLLAKIPSARYNFGKYR